MECTFHPSTETVLSCGQCGRSICPDCARNTSVGTRCVECLGERDPAIAGKDKYIPFFALASYDLRKVNERSQRRYIAGLFLTLCCVMLFAPLVLLPGLLLLAGTALWRGLENKWRLLSGVIYFIGVWLLVIPQLVTVPEQGGLSEIELSTGQAAFVAFVAALLIPFLWHPAQRCAVELLRQSRGISAGVMIGATLAATAISLGAAFLALVLTI